jgi:5'-nucleotidase
MIRYLTILLAVFSLTACTAPSEFVVTVIGTNDVHGELMPKPDRGGLVTVSGYIDAVRTARDADGGAVLLIDAGDMWQGTLESNLSEGRVMVSAYNALDYTAATIGNHEFDFGPLGPASTPSGSDDDPVGNLKQRATEAEFPLLSANLINTRTGERVDWPNVYPSTMVEVNGAKIGIIGVMTAGALRTTIAANVRELSVAPLAPAIQRQATELRDAGATLIIVTAHAGGRCTKFEDPNDLSSCFGASEIFEVANALPAGLVDHIIAGHVHQGIAHVVNGISITSSYASTRAFSHTDFTLDGQTGEVLGRRVHPPHLAVANAEYEGQLIKPNAEIIAIAQQAAEFAKEQKEAKLGVYLETPFTLVIHNVQGGLRTILSAGDLTFGDVYELSPFENRIVILELSGTELRQVVAEQAHRSRRAMGFTGMRVSVNCDAENMSVDMWLDGERPILDTDTIRIVVNDYMAFGGDNILASIMPDGGYPVDESLPLTRDVFVEWLTDRGGTLNASDFDTSSAPKWRRPRELNRECQLN